MNNDTDKTLKLEIRGFVVVDTLEFLKDGKVICTASGPSFKMNRGNLFNANGSFKVQIRKKGESKIIGQFEFADQPFYQVKKIFYDGTTLSDNVKLTPVSDTANTGFRIRFSTNFPPFYGGPVDIVIYDAMTINDPFSFTLTPVKTVKNVTGTFSDFFELPQLPELTDNISHYYYFKVYKSGTNEPPYSNLDPSNSAVDDFNYNFGPLNYLVPGDSRLLSISPTTSDYGGGVFVLEYGYDIVDYSAPFK